jgi:predicted transcriptional regulator
MMSAIDQTRILLKLLERGDRQVEEGRVHKAEDVIAWLRMKYGASKNTPQSSS